MPQSPSSEELLEHSAINLRASSEPELQGFSHLFQLGAYAERVTILSQQVRAINLAWALFDSETLPSAARIAVIGGGIAGCTFAAAAARLGWSLELFEERGDLLARQTQCHTRLVHPHILDWPQPAADVGATNLPFLNWHAGPVNNVIATFRKSIPELLSTTKRHTQCRCTRLVPMRHQVGLLCGPRNTPQGPFDAVVFAAGFGSDGDLRKNFPDYWHNDAFDEVPLTARRPSTWLVSGCGDGGLVDTMRLALSSFHNGFAILPLLQSEPLAELRKELARVEQELYTLGTDAASDEQVSVDLWNHYSNLAVPRVLLDAISEHRRDDNAVTLNGSTSTCLTRSACILNRLIMFLLVSQKHVGYLPGRLWACGIPQYLLKGDAKGWEVTVRDRGREQVYTFDGVVVRHGPRSEYDQLLPAESVAALRVSAPVSSRITSQPAWPTGFWDDPAKTRNDLGGPRPPKPPSSPPVREPRTEVGPAQTGVLAWLTGRGTRRSLGQGTMLKNLSNESAKRAGSFGAFIRLEDGALACFTAAHAIGGGGGGARVGDRIAVVEHTQASPIHEIGELVQISTSEENDFLDVAVVRLAGAVARRLEPQLRRAKSILDPDAILDPYAAVATMALVWKIGAGTGYTSGRIGGLLSLNIRTRSEPGKPGKPHRIQEALEITGANVATAFAGPGDSGALIVEKDSLKCVGVLVSTSLMYRGYAIPLGKVLSWAKAELVPQPRTCRW